MSTTFNAKDWKIVCLRETPLAAELQRADTPETAAAYWRATVPTHPFFNPEVECLVALILDTRRKIKGHCFISSGTMDTILVHPREVFRPAIIGAAAAIVLLHNHPSGDPTPSEGDIRITRELVKAGQLLRIEVLDHIVMGRPTLDRPKDYVSLRELGYFYN